ncbi:magnesium transporter CorA family protein [Bradyrhizobium sp. S69]|uniref:magnesium transporter CorA family protein n=1 Tax=Bradyrhizobium sp. S69 TaxID=1641856 RepID=UPI00131B783E|nr:magnesium transporter CorA family protein [Bradyrhizobium sp. S69]
MLKMYRSQGGDWTTAGTELPPEIIWIDLLNPTPDEVRFVEAGVKIRVPTEAALSEIEASSRLRLDHHVLYLSSPVVTLDASGEAHLTPVGFVITATVLVTVRFFTSPAFDSVAARIDGDDSLKNGMCVFTSLLEAVVDRGADVLEHLGATADELARSVFKGGLKQSKGPVRSTRKLREALANVGVLADRLAKARDVLLGAGRVASYADDVGREWITASSRIRLEAVSKDVVSLSDYESRLSDKIQLLLDAVLGFINIEQNDLFKILTIVSVVGIPPTLLAGIWGMNFKNMPELNWEWGYALAWIAIIASGLLPLLWFKLRGWIE